MDIVGNLYFWHKDFIEHRVKKDMTENGSLVYLKSLYRNVVEDALDENIDETKLKLRTFTFDGGRAAIVIRGIADEQSLILYVLTGKRECLYYEFH